jgi:hypothetical protein
MGKTSRRKVKGETGGQQLATAPGLAKPDDRQNIIPGHYGFDRWEKLALLCTAITLTMRFLGPYIPGATIFMKTPLVTSLTSAAFGLSTAGILFSVIKPWIHGGPRYRGY